MFRCLRVSLRSVFVAVLAVALAIAAAKRHLGPTLDVRLLHAATRGDVQAARWYLACGADINSGDWTPLTKTTFNGQSEMLGFLVDRGADLDHFEYHDSYTALRLAEFQGYWDIAILLANAGASDHIDDGRDWYVINYARHAGREDAVDALRPWHRANGTRWEKRQNTVNPPPK
jgi:ankyrin repeat protein